MTDHQKVSLAEYVERRGDWLGGCAYLLTRDHDAALDLVQDTLLQAWKARDLVNGADDPERYILRIMLNTHRGRARRRRLHLVSLDGDHRGASAVFDETSRVDDADLVAHALSELSQRQQAVVILRYWADYADRQIAEALGCQRATVRSLAARGLHKLKRCLESS